MINTTEINVPVGQPIYRVTYKPQVVAGNDPFVVTNRGVFRRMSTYSVVLADGILVAEQWFDGTREAGEYRIDRVRDKSHTDLATELSTTLFCVKDRIDDAKEMCLQLYLISVSKAIESHTVAAERLKATLIPTTRLLKGKLSHDRMAPVVHKVAELYGDTCPKPSVGISTYQHTYHTGRNRVITSELSRDFNKGSVTYRELSGGHPQSDPVILYRVSLDPEMSPEQAVGKLQKLIDKAQEPKRFPL